MSTEPAGEGAEDDHEPGPPTVDAILDDAREAIDSPPTDPSYHSSTTTTSSITHQSQLGCSYVTVEEADSDDLEADLRAWVYDGSVSFSIEAKGRGDRHIETAVSLSPEEARNVGLQLLASASVIDRESKHPAGYLAE